MNKQEIRQVVRQKLDGCVSDEVFNYTLSAIDCYDSELQKRLLDKGMEEARIFRERADKYIKYLSYNEIADIKATKCPNCGNCI